MNENIQISAFFVDKFFKDAKPSFIIVYILLLRLCKDNTCSIRKLADFLDFTESDISRALKYWEKNKVIKLSDVDFESNFKVDFLNSDNYNEETAGKQADDAKLLPQAIAESRPVYSTKEIDEYLRSNTELRTLFKLCETYLGKLLSYNDMCVLFSFHDWLRMPLSLIELLVEYCASNDHRSIRYIEKVALTWTDAGIRTTEQAKERIKLYNKDFRLIMSELGKSSREPTRIEEGFMIKWIKTYSLPMEVIIAACERTVMQIARPNFKYADGILERWHMQGVSSVDDVLKLDEEYKSQKVSDTAESKKPKKTAKRSKFSNFKERESVDFAELTRLEMERIDKEIDS